MLGWDHDKIVSTHIYLTDTYHVTKLKVNEIGFIFLFQGRWYNNEWKPWPYHRKKEWPARSINSMHHNDFSPILSQNCTSCWSCFWPWYVKVNPSEILFIFHQTKLTDHWEFHDALFSSACYDFFHLIASS